VEAKDVIEGVSEDAEDTRLCVAGVDLVDIEDVE
jgi:hypothetical protein